MLSRRKLFGFLAAAPAAGAAAAKASQPERSFFRMQLDPADFKPIPFVIDDTMICEGANKARGINVEGLTMADYNMGTITAGTISRV